MPDYDTQKVYHGLNCLWDNIEHTDTPEVAENDGDNLTIFSVTVNDPEMGIHFVGTAWAHKTGTSNKWCTGTEDKHHILDHPSNPTRCTACDLSVKIV